jgi:hypothetical protein
MRQDLNVKLSIFGEIFFENVFVDIFVDIFVDVFVCSVLTDLVQEVWVADEGGAEDAEVLRLHVLGVRRGVAQRDGVLLKEKQINNYFYFYNRKDLTATCYCKSQQYTYRLSF